MLDKKELNEKIEAFISSKGEKLNAEEKNKLKKIEALMKKYFRDDFLKVFPNFISLIKNYKFFINYIGLENLNKVIETKNSRHIFYFALFMDGVNIKKLENAIIETKDAEYIYYFARYVKGANIEKLENEIIETKDAEYIYYFARFIKGANMYKCLYKIKELNSQSDFYFSNFEISLEKIAISRDLENIHNCVAAEEKKQQALTKLINNRHEGNNEIKLGIYFDYLNNPEATIEDLNKCDREYLDYMCSLEEEKSSNKKKVKIRKKRVN